MSEASSTNGVATPVSSQMNSLALHQNECSPQSERGERKLFGLDWGIPDAFLLPNGYPDVSLSLSNVFEARCSR